MTSVGRALEAEASESLWSRATLRGGDPDPPPSRAVGRRAVNALEVVGRANSVDISIIATQTQEAVTGNEKFDRMLQRRSRQ